MVKDIRTFVQVVVFRYWWSFLGGAIPTIWGLVMPSIGDAFNHPEWKTHVPLPIVWGAIGLGSLIACFLAWRDDHRKSQELSDKFVPKLEMSFQFSDPYTKRIRANVPLIQNHPAATELRRHFHLPDDVDREVIASAFWVRILVTNASSATAHRCRVFLHNVEYSIDGTEFESVGFGSSQILRWADMGDSKDWFVPRDIASGQRCYVDVFSTDEVYDYIWIKWSINLISYQDMFRRIGKYRLVILATSEDGGDVTTKLLVDWPGKWDQVTAREE